MQGQAICDDTDVITFHLYVGLTDGNRVVAVGDLASDQAVRALVLQEHYRIIISNGALEKPFRVVRGRGSDDLQAGGMCEVCLRAL